MQIFLFYRSWHIGRSIHVRGKSSSPCDRKVFNEISKAVLHGVTPKCYEYSMVSPQVVSVC